MIWVRFFEVLLDSIDGFLAFCFDDVRVVLLRDSAPSENSDSIYMSIALENGKIHGNVLYEFEISNLGLLRKRDNSLKEAARAQQKIVAER